MSDRQRIAIIGTGISGLTSAYLLSGNHDVTVYEANQYLGGHTNTIKVAVDGGELAVDTGFIVFNDRNYPNFLKLLGQLGLAYQPTEMSFSVRNEGTGLEYNGHNLNTLFAQRSNVLRPEFYRMVSDILSFNKKAKSALATGDIADMTLDSYVESLGLGKPFRKNYLYPMVSAIWSCSVNQAGQVPLVFFLKFFNNHGLLGIKDRPQWFVLKGGSSSYIDPMTRKIRENIRLGDAVQQVQRHEDYVSVTSVNGEADYDQVILACHSDQALAMLGDASQQENEVLGAIGFQPNSVILHTDDSIMPRHHRAWASWNFNIEDSGVAVSQDSDLPLVTYSMNILQGIQSSRPLLVSLNADHRIDPAKRIREFTYDHPVFGNDMVLSQSRRDEISGQRRTHYCGAYWYNGFHEDGVVSALDVCRHFGAGLQ